MFGIGVGLNFLQNDGAGGVVSPPVNVTPPVLTGRAVVGQTLTCPTGTWANNPTMFEYRWQNNGSDNGDTDNQYTIVSGDDTDNLKCLLRAGNSAGWSDWVESNTVIGLLSGVWYDGDDATTIIHTLGSVSQWNDKSGEGNHATQGTGSAQPFTGTRTTNERNVIEMAGAQNLIMPAGIRDISSGNNTLFIVATEDTFASSSAFLIGWQGSDTYGFLSQGGMNNQRALHCSFANRLTVAATRDANAHTHILRRNGTSLEYKYDGSVASGANANAVSFTQGAMRMGISDVGGSLLDGTIAEVIGFRRALSIAEMNQVGNELAVKWGTTWTNIV